MKHKRIASDIQAARKRAGLRQVDCAHLLGIGISRLSEIENGHALPNAREIATFSIVYSREIESLLSGLLDEVLDGLVERLRSVPPVGEDTRGTAGRASTLSDLAKRLEVLTSTPHGRR